MATASGGAIAPEELTVDSLNNIFQLDVSSRSLNSIPVPLDGLTSVETLNLSRSDFESVPEAVLGLRTLRELQLSRNRIHELPARIGDLRALRGLYVSRNLIPEIPAAIGRLRQLRTLNVRNNRLSALPEELYELATLDELDVSENSIRELSSSIVNLPSLRNLYLSGNDLRRLPENIGYLSALESLAISGNQLQELPSSIARLGDLKSFWVYDNPLAVPPIEVANRGLSDIRAYFYALDSGAAQLQRQIRVLVLGQPRVGKTSLISRLVRDRFDARRRETLGVEISDWQGVGAGPKVLFWDFGGQDHMHAAHRLFIGGGEFYLVVVDARYPDEIEYWLQIIQGANPSARVVVVLNKRDLDDTADIDRRFLSSKYRCISGYFETSCKTGRGLARLGGDIRGAAEALVGERANNLTVPVTWALVHDRLVGSKQPHISVDTFREICRSEGCADAFEQDSLLNFLARVGAIVLLDRTRPQTVITDPEWIVDGIYSVIASRHVRESQGVITETAIGTLLGNLKKYSGADTRLIVDALKAYDFAVELPGGMLLIPELLPELAPLELVTDDVHAVHHIIQVRGDSSFLLGRALSRLASDVVPTQSWRRGAFLRSSQVDATALVISDERDRQLRIHCWGTGRISYLGYVRLAIRAVASDFGDISIAEFIPLDDLGASVEYDEILGLYLMGERDLCLGKAGARRDIQALLFGVDNQGGKLLMTGPVYNFDRSAVSFGSGNAMNINSGEMRSVVAQLMHELEQSDTPEAVEMRQELSDAAVASDRSKLKSVGEKISRVFAGAAPIVALANSVISIAGHHG
jgi:small GTP-binding protein